MKSRVKFPRTFLWGTATSAHQVEGGNIYNDWSKFKDPGSRAGQASDFFHHFEADLDLAAELGTNSFRFSVEWSRLEPHCGQRCPQALNYYHRLVDACLDRGLTPFLTLHQFTLPQWIADKGGWLNPETIDAFKSHCEYVADQFADRVAHFVTINEPNVQAGASYLAGLFPPGKRFRPDLADRCQAALLLAHGQVYKALHRVQSTRFPSSPLQVGISPHFISWTKSSWDLAGLVQGIGRQFNRALLDALFTGELKLQTLRRRAPEFKGCLDFIGVNYFMGLPAHLLGALRFMGLARKPVHEATGDNGWPVDSQGFEDILIGLSRDYQKPLYVTENGIADRTDLKRQRYLVEHLAALNRAMGRGADVRAYFHWSLIDNFEWHEGFGPRFGLYEVDYQSQERKARGSAKLYSQLIRQYSAVKEVPCYGQ